MRAIITLLLLMISGCSTVIKLVDSNGVPVQGAVVLSEQLPFILQDFEIAASVSDVNGKALTADSIGHVYHKNYHPIINGSDISIDIFIPNFMGKRYFERSVKLHRIIDPGKIPFQLEKLQLKYGEGISEKKLKIDECRETTVVHNFEDNTYVVESKKDELIPSDRFFFDTAKLTDKTRILTGNESIFFYCPTVTGNYVKIGIGTNHRYSLSGQHYHGLIKLDAEITLLDEVIEPPVAKLAKPDAFFYLFDTDEPSADLIMNTELDEFEKSYNTHVPENTEQEIEFKEAWLARLKKQAMNN